MILSALFFFYLMKPTGSASGDFAGAGSTMVGKRGIAISELGPTGKVMVDGLEWTATTKAGEQIHEKEEISVLAVYGSEVLVVSNEPPRVESKGWSGFGKILRKK